MKEITAIIQPIRLGPVRVALSEAGVTGMTVTDVRGFGAQGGSTDTYRGTEYRVDYVPKARIDVVVTDDVVDDAVSALMSAALTGNVGDGKIWVRNVEAVYRIRTGDRDDAALK